MSQRKGNLYVISGASGVGKSTVIARLLEENKSLYFSISCTTRAPREGEVDGVNYHFIKREEFEQKIRDGEFLEHAQYVGNYYGTSGKIVREKLNAGYDVLLDIEVQGAEQVRGNCPDATLVFIIPPSFEELARRLRARNTDSEEKVQGRLKRAREEYQKIPEYHYLVVNDKVEDAVKELGSIITAEECRVSRRIYLTEGV